MTELEAVNLVLRALSEHTVSSVEVRHPSVTLALDNLNISREEILSEGWWFNTRTATLSPQVDGRIKMPTGTLSFVPSNDIGVVSDGYIYDTVNETFVFTAPVTGVLVADVTFQNLPPPAQRYVAYSAAIYSYMSDVGDKIPPQLQAGLSLAMSQLSAGHGRQRRFSARNRRAWQRYEYARRG